jgi:hypothetical protein
MGFTAGDARFDPLSGGVSVPGRATASPEEVGAMTAGGGGEREGVGGAAEEEGAGSSSISLSPPFSTSLPVGCAFAGAETALTEAVGLSTTTAGMEFGTKTATTGGGERGGEGAEGEDDTTCARGCEAVSWVKPESGINGAIGGEGRRFSPRARSINGRGVNRSTSGRWKAAFVHSRESRTSTFSGVAICAISEGGWGCVERVWCVCVCVCLFLLRFETAGQKVVTHTTHRQVW